MSTGYVYCMSNPAMPGMVKIGYTERPMEDRIQEANIACTWIPLPFTVEFARRVKDPNHKEQIVHRILKEKRVNPKREFFRVTAEEVKLLFELMDGTWWDPEECEEEEQPIVGTEVIRMFLDKFIHPAAAGDVPATASGVTTTFNEWKTREGYKYGRPAEVVEKLRSQFGPPKPGVGWSEITLRK